MMVRMRGDACNGLNAAMGADGERTGIRTKLLALEAA
jgi:hypothetical protein